MPYGIIKIDTITFTDAGVDKSVAISGLVQNPTFTGNVTATGTISGLIVQAPTVTGTTANFASGVYTTQISGAIVKVPAGSAGAPSIQVGVGASVAPGLYGAGTDLLGISTGGAGRIFIDSTGQLGIGTSSPSQALEVAGNISFTANAASARIFGPPLSSDTTLVLRGGSSTGEGANIELGRDEVVYIDATQHLFRSLAGTERARIDNSGRLLVGTSSNRPSRIGTSSFNSLLQIESDTEAAQSITRWAADSNSSRLHLQKGRGTGASPTIVAADDNLGDFTFSGYDGANMTNGARITAAVDGTPGTNDMPGRLVFSTTADGASTPTERLRIDSSGRVGIGTNAPVYSLDVTGRIRGVGSSTALIASNGSGTDQTSISLIREGAATNQKTWELLTGSGGDFRIRTISDDYTASQDAIVVTRGSGFSIDNVQLHANGSERLRIDGVGNVGIGTSSPNYVLDLNSGGTVPAQIGTTVNWNFPGFILRRNASNVSTAKMLSMMLQGDTDSDTTLTNYLNIWGTYSAAPTTGSTTAGLSGVMNLGAPSGIALHVNNSERARITSGGYLKASNDGNYFGLTGAYHETYQTADEPTLVARATNATLTNALHYAVASRAANSAYFFFVGTSGYGGTADDEFKLYGDGNGKCDGAWTGGGADYAEYFEWSDGNFSAEDRRGISVVLNGGKIQPALVGEDPVGVISGNPSVVGDAAWNKWSGKYLRDEYGTYIQEDYEVEDEDGNAVIQQRRKLNPAYDPNQEYVSREERPEWDCVGLMGKLRIRKGQPTGSRWIKMRDISNSVEEWLVR
jgi:hypothetical protein